MYQLATLWDNVRIAPADFGKPVKQAIVDEINFKYSNKVVEELGLCLCVFDLLENEDAIVFPGEGASFIKGTTRGFLIWQSNLD